VKVADEVVQNGDSRKQFLNPVAVDGIVRNVDLRTASKPCSG